MHLITDRTEADALLKNEKGTYGYNDLNRVETAVAEISSFFPALGMDEMYLETKTNWGPPGAFSTDQWPTYSQMDRYLSNVALIRNAFGLSVLLPKRLDRLTWSQANNIERVLQQAYQRAQNAVQVFRYSGEIYSGEA